jgi:hypothetical protein
VSANELGQVVDPAALNEAGGPRGKLAVEVPAAWLASRGALEVTLPRRLACARCDGGGCDGCLRAGAVTAPAGVAPTCVRIELPGDGHDVALRIAHPEGPEGWLAQLILEVRRGEFASPGVTRVTPQPAEPSLARVAATGTRPALTWKAVAIAALAAAAAILAALLGR